MNIEKLHEWYKSFTHGMITYKNGSNFKSKIIKNDTKLKFGKYKGKTIDWVKHNDPNYINWCLDNIEEFEHEYLKSDQT